MTPQQAIELIDRAIQSVVATREAHIKLQEAVSIINDLINKKDTVDAK